MINDHSLRTYVPQDISLENILYSNERVGNVFTNAKSAFDFIIGSLYPNYVGTFANQAALPVTANANDYAWVSDDGDGKGAGYVWTDLDGIAQWVKRYDVDWSVEGLLSDALSQTFPLYVFGNGKDGGQEIFGGTATGEDLVLNANAADDTGNIVAKNPIIPHTDNTDDLGSATNRIKDFFIAGMLQSGSVSLSLAQLQTAFDHISLVNNPHSVDYDQLLTKLGVLTVNGDVTGSVDLSTSGVKSLTLTVGDDSHNHTAAFITDFNDAVWAKVKAILQNNDLITYTKTEGAETITPTVANITTARIDDIDSPVSANKVLASDGSKYSEKGITVELTGDVSGTGTYNTTTEKIDLSTVSNGTDLENVRGIELENLAISFAVGNPALVNAPQHKMQTGLNAYLKSTDLQVDGEYPVTVVDADHFTIPVNITTPVSGFFIPNNAQFLFDSSTNTWKVRREFEEVTHAELSNLDQDDHSQYVKKDGRATGQSIQGGIAASENLVLESTSHATKGRVVVRDDLEFEADNVKDFGSLLKRVKDIYMAGQLIGGRVENVSSLPAPSGLTRARLVYHTVEDKLYYDNGLTYKPLSSSNLSKNNVTFAGETTLLVDVSGNFEAGETTSDFNWLLKEDTTNQTVHGDITRENATQVRITLNAPLTGSFKLIGM